MLVPTGVYNIASRYRRQTEIMVWLRASKRVLIDKRLIVMDVDIIKRSWREEPETLERAARIRYILTTYRMTSPEGKRFLLVAIKIKRGTKLIQSILWVRPLPESFLTENHLSYLNSTKLDRIIKVAVRRRYTSRSRTLRQVEKMENARIEVEADILSPVEDSVIAYTRSYRNQAMQFWS